MNFFYKMISTIAGVSTLGLICNTASADVDVSSNFHRWAMKNQSVVVHAGNWVAYDFSIPISGNITVDVEVKSGTFNDGSAYVCDKVGYQRFQQKKPNNCLGMSRIKKRINFTVPISSAGTYYLVLDNSFSLLSSKLYSASVIVPERMNLEFYLGIINVLTTVEDYVTSTFKAPRFNLSVQSCGEVNAYSVISTGDIVLCSELLFEAGEDESIGVIIGTLFHELGHSLLNLWGLPNFSNEEAVDAFATYIMLQYFDISLLEDFISYHERQNSWAQARRLIGQGGPHPLSIQRARNIRQNIKTAATFSERWNRLIYPHMADTSLISMVRNPTRYSSVNIAQQTLMARGVTW